MFRIIFFTLSLLLIGCQDSSQKKISSKDVQDYKNRLVGIHKELVKHQADSIKHYVDSHHLEMKQTKTGLWYQIYEDVPGKNVAMGQEVYLKYKLSLLDGLECYTSDSLGYKKYVTGRGGVEAGLEEGVMLMSKGDKARFILPSYLAHGVAGDQNCIPRLSIILYDVELVEVSVY